MLAELIEIRDYLRACTNSPKMAARLDKVIAALSDDTGMPEYPILHQCGLCGSPAMVERNDYDALRAHTERLERDAGRYRWLKSLKNHNVHLVDASGGKDRVVFVYMAERLDNAIDAMQEKGAG